LAANLLNKKPTIDWQSWVLKILVGSFRRFLPRCQKPGVSAKSALLR
jgi:hypothetical protein